MTRPIRLALSAVLLLLAVLFVMPAPDARAAPGVQLGDGISRVEARPDVEPDDVKESSSLPFNEPPASSGSAFAQQETTVSDSDAGLVLDSLSELSASDNDFAYTRVERSFTVTSPARVKISGALSDSQSSGESNLQRVELSGPGLGTDLAFDDANDPSFSVERDIEPGTYELLIDGSCEPPSGTNCSANLQAKVEFVGSVQHFRVELKAWIPKAAVVDPNIPLPLPVIALLAPPVRFLVFPEPRAPCQLPPSPPPNPTLLSSVESGFRGDAHAEYDGSFRVRPVAEFDWDGAEISNFTVTQPADHFGITILDYAYRVSETEIIRCARVKQQVSQAGGQQLSSTSFELSMSADDPLVYPRPTDPDSVVVPNIDARMVGRFGSDGRLTLDYDTDLFPSHGLRVTVDGVDRETRVTNDVSCLDDSSVTGLFGMGALATALSLHDNVGSLVVDPAQAPQSSSTPGPVCSVSFLTLDFVSFARSLLVPGQSASAA